MAHQREPEEFWFAAGFRQYDGYQTSLVNFSWSSGYLGLDDVEARIKVAVKLTPTISDRKCRSSTTTEAKRAQRG
jgi:hypothetical protein